MAKEQYKLDFVKKEIVFEYDFLDALEKNPKKNTEKARIYNELIAQYPSFTIKKKKKPAKNSGINKEFILKYVEDHGKEAQLKEYKEFEGNFFALKKKFLQEFKIK